VAREYKVVASARGTGDLVIAGDGPIYSCPDCHLLTENKEGHDDWHSMLVRNAAEHHHRNVRIGKGW